MHLYVLPPSPPLPHQLVGGDDYPVHHQGDDGEEDEEPGEEEAEEEGGADGEEGDDGGGGFAEGSFFVFHCGAVLITPAKFALRPDNF